MCVFTLCNPRCILVLYYHCRTPRLLIIYTPPPPPSRANISNHFHSSAAAAPSSRVFSTLRLALKHDVIADVSHLVHIYSIYNNVIQAAGASAASELNDAIICESALSLRFVSCILNTLCAREDLIIYGVALHHLAGSLFNIRRIVRVCIWWFERLSSAFKHLFVTGLV